jgi:hypothetical protein
MNKPWFWLLMVISVLGLLHRLSQPQPLFPLSPVRQPPGLIIAPDPPTQKLLHGGTGIAFAGAALTPLADYHFDARLLSLVWYHSDGGAKYSPVDLGIAWGKMSDSANIDALHWTHGGRFLNYAYSQGPPLPQPEMQRSIANMHVLPANASILKAISRFRPGQRIAGTGLLVKLTGADGYTWVSSLSREDSGGGACELIYLTEVHALP